MTASTTASIPRGTHVGHTDLRATSFPFASAARVGRMVLGDPVPRHPLDLPWDDAPGWEGVPWDREARPSLGALTPEQLDDEWQHRLYAERDPDALVTTTKEN